MSDIEVIKLMLGVIAGFTVVSMFLLAAILGALQGLGKHTSKKETSNERN
jgi:hypothetical protein